MKKITKMQQQQQVWKFAITNTTFLIAFAILYPSLAFKTVSAAVPTVAVGGLQHEKNPSDYRYLRNDKDKKINTDKEEKKCLPLSCDELEIQKEEIRFADEAWLQAAVMKDVDLTLSFWSKDATVIAPNELPRVGHDSIRVMLTTLFVNLEGSSITWNVNRIEMHSYGGVGYAYWTNQIDFGESNGIPMFYGQGVSTWTKQEDTGDWKVTLDIWNEQQQPQK